MAPPKPQTPKIDWLETYKLNSGSPNLKSDFLSFANGKWTNEKRRYWSLDAKTGEALGVSPVDGKYYITPNDLAWLIQASTDVNAKQTVAPYAGGIFDVVSNILNLAPYKDVSSYSAASGRGDLKSASQFLLKAVNNVMTGSPNLQASAAKLGETPVNLKDYLSYQAPSAGPRTVAWTRNQHSQIAGFVGNWLGYNNPAVVQEIANAVNKGMSAYEIEQQLFSKNPDPTVANAARSFQKAFPALATARQQGKDIGISSPADYLRAKNAYVAALRPYGLDKNFTPEQLDNMMVNSVTPQDLGKWAGMAWETVQNADPRLKANLKAQFGLTNQDLQAYLMLPENVGSEQVADKVRATQLYTSGQDAGVTMPDAFKLTGLVDQGQISQQQAQQAVQKAAAMQNLGQEAFGFQQGTQTTANAQDVMSAVVPEFAPNATAAAESARKVQQAQEERAQATKAGGQLLTDQQGVKGAGRAQ